MVEALESSTGTALANVTLFFIDFKVSPSGPSTVDFPEFRASDFSELPRSSVPVVSAVSSNTCSGSGAPADVADGISAGSASSSTSFSTFDSDGISVTPAFRRASTTWGAASPGIVVVLACSKSVMFQMPYYYTPTYKSHFPLRPTLHGSLSKAAPLYSAPRAAG